MPKDDTDRRADHRNFYVKRVGRKLRKAQRFYLDTERVKYDVANSLIEIPNGHRVDLAGYFGNRSEIWLEIGFGSGEHLLHQAKRNNDVGLIGCEVYLNGVASFLSKLQSETVTNIGLFTDDVRNLFDWLPDRSIDRVFLLYPDPWPKKKHHRRRFVNPDFLNPLARIMAMGAILRIATDIPDYARQTIEQLYRHSDFVWLAETASDWQHPWSDWIPTRYEQKAVREGRVPIYLTFQKV